MNLANEYLLLLDCTTPRPQSDVISRIERRVERGLDWHAVFQAAIPHGVMPLVAESLLRYALICMPSDLPAQLRSLLHRNRLRHERQCSSLSNVMTALSTAEVRALAFKGPTLGAVAYHDCNLREFHDLDVWTDRADLARAGSLLRSMSFRPAAYKGGAPVPFRDDLGDEHTQFISLDGSVIVELQDVRQASHFHFRPDFEELWLKRKRIRLRQFEFETLSPEDLLLVLAAHGSKHCWRRLNWVVDIAGMIELHPDLNWTTVMERSEQWRCRRRLVVAVALAERLYGVGVPSVVKRAIAKDRDACLLVGNYVAKTIGNAAVGTPALRLINNPVVRSIREVHYHCKLTDRGIDQLSVFYSELARRAKWTLTALREQ